MPRWTNSYRNNRASYRGGRQTQRSTSEPSTPHPPFGSLLLEISKSDLIQDAEKYMPSAVIKDCELVASYNWLDKSQPTMLIPGKPPRWSPPAVPKPLPEDSGIYFRDRNAARYPSHPLEPAVVASLSADDSLPIKTDVVACSNTLINLFRFLRGEDKRFRMLAQEVGSTLFLTRRENSPTETIPDVRGHGHTFPEAYTTWEDEARGSASHHRVLRYRFGELDFLLRFDADGYLGGDALPPSPPLSSSKLSSSSSPPPPPLTKRPPPPPPLTRRPPPPPPPRKTAAAAAAASSTLDDLADILAGNKVTAPLPSTTATELAARRGGGTVVPQRLIFELKTRGQWKKDKVDTLAEQLPRLWAAQIPHFVLAFHRGGVFDDIQVRSVVRDVAAWEAKHASDLAYLAALVHRIAARVAEQPDKKLEVVFRGVGPLELREQKPGIKDVLSDHTARVWKGEADWCGIGELEVGVHLRNDNAVAAAAAAVGAGIWDDEDGFGSDRDEDNGGVDFTGCSVDCGYCGKCPH